MNMDRYVRKSLELHLFFGRIMKEHALFLRAGFTPADPAFSEKAEHYLTAFEGLLRDAVALSDGVAGRKVLSSGEVVTEFTAQAEKQTEAFTCIPIDKELTARTLCLRPAQQRTDCRRLYGRVRQLNRRSLKLLDGLISFKEDILKCVQQGEMFTLNYPLLIEHILREARLYRSYVEILERRGDLPDRLVRNKEVFWNQIMMEHAQFIRGLLDPCEEELFDAADDFAWEYCRLLEESRKACDRSLTEASLVQTLRFRDFKAAGTRGIGQGKIRSVILPLLADHVLREANHYVRLLQEE